MRAFPEVAQACGFEKWVGCPNYFRADIEVAQADCELADPFRVYSAIWMAHYFDGTLLGITTVDYSTDVERLQVRIYPVGDILRRAYGNDENTIGKLIDFVTKTIRSNSWVDEDTIWIDDMGTIKRKIDRHFGSSEESRVGKKDEGGKEEVYSLFENTVLLSEGYGVIMAFGDKHLVVRQAESVHVDLEKNFATLRRILNAVEEKKAPVSAPLKTY